MRAIIPQTHPHGCCACLCLGCGCTASKITLTNRHGNHSIPSKQGGAFSGGIAAKQGEKE